VAGLLQMVHLRFLGEPPIIAGAISRSCPLSELGCAPTLRPKFCRDHPPCQGVYVLPELIHSGLTWLSLLQLLGEATEQMSLSLGQTLAGLLNATFGNAVEIIVGVVALLKGEFRLVQTSVCTRPAPPFSSTHVYWPCADARFHII
jgi:hypothetical protein